MEIVGVGYNTDVKKKGVVRVEIANFQCFTPFLSSAVADLTKKIVI